MARMWSTLAILAAALAIASGIRQPITQCRSVEPERQGVLPPPVLSERVAAALSTLFLWIQGDVMC